MRNMTAATLATVSNAEAIAIDQDPLGVQGMGYMPSVAPSANVSFYYKPLAAVAGAQSIAIAVLNRGLVNVSGQNVSLVDLGFPAAQSVVVLDVWANTTSAPYQGSFMTRSIESHEVLLLKLTPVISTGTHSEL